MQGLRNKLLSDGAWAFSAKILTGIAQIAVSAILARLLNVEAFGQFQALQRVVIAGSILGSFGLATVSVRKVAEGLALGKPGQSYAAVREIGRVVLVAGCLVAAILLVSGGYLIPEIAGHVSSEALLLVALLIIFASLQQVVPEFFRGLHDIRYSSLFSGAATNMMLLSALLVCWWAGVRISLDHALLLYGTASVVAVAAAIVVLLKMIRPYRAEGRVRQGVQEILQAGRPMMLSLLTLFVVKQADVWIVASLVSLEAAAYYAAVSRMIFVLTVPLMVANAVIKPLVTKYLVQGNTSAMQTLVAKVARGTFVIGLILALAMMFWSQDLLALLFGEKYRAGSEVLRILAGAQLATLLFGPCAVVLSMAGKEKHILRSTLAGAFAFVASATLLLPSFAENAVAIAVLIGTVVSQGSMMIGCVRFLGVRTDIFAPVRALA